MSTSVPPPPTPPPPTATGRCPACGASVATASQFCPQCGASLSKPPASGPLPVDLRTKVDQDRGTLKRLQLLLPGFRGYRLGEDIRVADSLLRRQVADKVHQAVAVVQDTRSALVQASRFDGLTDLAPVLSDLQRLEGEIRHAEQGYTGISPAVRVKPEELDRLYEYDYGFAEAADRVVLSTDPLRSAVGGSNGAQVATAIATLRVEVGQLDQAFKARMRAVEGIQVP